MLPTYTSEFKIVPDEMRTTVKKDLRVADEICNLLERLLVGVFEAIGP